MLAINLISQKFKRGKTNGLKHFIIFALIIFLDFVYLSYGQQKAEYIIEIDSTLTIKQIARRNQVASDKLLRQLKLMPGQETFKISQANCTVPQVGKAIRQIRLLETKRSSSKALYALAKFAFWTLKLLSKLFIDK